MPVPSKKDARRIRRAGAMPPADDWPWKKGDEASRRLWAASDAAIAAALQVGADAAAADAAEAAADGRRPPTPLSLADAYGPDSAVLLTGASGYIGSVILEHLLRFTACPRVVCVVRPRRGASGAARMDRLLARPLFSALHDDKAACTLPPSTRARVVVVAGDLLEPGLGLSPEDAARITATTTHIIHCAASISFTDPVTALLAHNYDAVAAVLALAQACGPSLRAYVHISTAYVNGHLPPRSVVSEALHPVATPDGRPFDHAALAAQLRGLDPAAADARAAAFLASSGLPNTYCLTKHMAERLVADVAARPGTRFGVAIVRPAIVGALSPHSPAPGYVGNMSGVASVYLVYASGLATFTSHGADSVMDLVPGDCVAGVVVAGGAAAAERAGAPDRATPPLIFHSGTSTTHPLTMLQLLAVHVYQHVSADKPPFRFSFRYPTVRAQTVHRHFLDHHSLAFKLRSSIAYAKLDALRGLLRAAGKPDLAAKVGDGKRSLILYEVPAMDFDLRFTDTATAALEARLEAAADNPQGMRLRWTAAAGDDWAAFCGPYFTSIKARQFGAFAKKVKPAAGGSAVARAATAVKAAVAPADSPAAPATPERLSPAPAARLPGSALRPAVAALKLPASLAGWRLARGGRAATTKCDSASEAHKLADAAGAVVAVAPEE